jgi:hypothetical protein
MRRVSFEDPDWTLETLDSDGKVIDRWDSGALEELCLMLTDEQHPEFVDHSSDYSSDPEV